MCFCPHNQVIPWFEPGWDHNKSFTEMGGFFYGIKCLKIKYFVIFEYKVRLKSSQKIVFRVSHS